MSEVVQFREDPEALGYLRERGINPNRFAREAFEAMLRKLKAEEAADELAGIQARLPRPIEEMIREDRER